MLTLSVVLGIVQLVAASHAASLQRGCRYSASPRDEAMSPLRGVAGRLDRAIGNFVETFPLFAAVVLAAHVSDTQRTHRVGCATVLVGSRRLGAGAGGAQLGGPLPPGAETTARRLISQPSLWRHCKQLADATEGAGLREHTKTGSRVVEKTSSRLLGE
jgi:uncharacterized MAPEG superfamily protein